MPERTYEWHEPTTTASAAASMSGLELLRGLVDGTVPPPPIASTLGFDMELVEEGVVVFAVDPAGFHYNPIGSVHGGLYATLLDSAAACAVHSTLPAGVGYTSLDLSVKFLRRVTVDTGRLRCTGRVVHAGRSTALARAELTDSDGRLVAEATSSCLILRP